MTRKTWVKTLLEGIADAAGATLAPTDRLSKLTDTVSAIEWVLVVLAIESELKVAVPDALTSKRTLRVSEFVDRVVLLPKVDDPFWSLNRLGLLAGALLPDAPEKKATAKRAAAKATPKAKAKKRA